MHRPGGKISDAAELLAYHFMAGKDLAQPPVSETHDQQSFIDERIHPAEEIRAAKKQKKRGNKGSGRGG